MAYICFYRKTQNHHPVYMVIRKSIYAIGR